MEELGSQLERSCNSDNKDDDEEEDRFSILPDSLSHHIFSFLTMPDIAKLSFTSKTFRDLCLSIPSLVVDYTQVKYVGRIQILDFLVGLVRYHRSTNLNRLTIRWSNVGGLTCNETSRISLLMNNAIQCNVSEINLTLLPEGGVFVIPFYLFYGDSLRFLKVNLKNYKVEFPYPYRFTHLQRLHLKKVLISCEDFGEWISTFCKFLKKLKLKQVSGINKLKIASSSLQFIAIRHCRLHHIDISGKSLKDIVLIKPFSSSNRTSLNIRAPAIWELIWVDFSTNYYSLGNMNMLEFVSLEVSPGMDRMKSNSLLKTIAHIPYLCITSECIKVFYEDHSLPFVFNSLQNLELLHYGLTDSVVPSLAVFFQGLQLSVKTLYIAPEYHGEMNTESSSELTSGFGATFWEKGNYLFVRGLEALEIELVGGKNEEGLIEYLLKYATKLKMIIFYCGPSLPTKIASDLMTTALARGGANFCYTEGKMVLELNP